MVRPALIICAGLVLTAGAHAGVIVSIEDEILNGTYGPRQTITVPIVLTQTPGGEDIGIRGLGFDFGLTDPALDVSDFSRNHGNMLPDPWMLYVWFEDLPRPAGVYTATAPPDPLELGMWILPESGSTTPAQFELTVPAVAGEWIVDFMSPEEPGNPNHGFWLAFDFENPTYWRLGDGAAWGLPEGWTDLRLAGDGQEYHFVPEPTCLVLLALGGLALLRRQRRAGAVTRISSAPTRSVGDPSRFSRSPRSSRA